MAASDRTAGEDAAPDWAALRAEFPILERKVYLNSNSLGALSRTAIAARRRFEELWNELGASAWYEAWLAELEEVRAAFARTVAADAGSVALMPSVSAALAAVAGALEAARRTGALAARRKVVVTELDFPTVGHQFLSRAPLGIEVVVVESPDGVEVPLEAIAEAVDEETLLLATSHVFYGTGAIQDARALADLAHGAGAFICLDAYQSNGQLPIDARALDVDFLVSGALKWLCGGPGLAFLYVRPGVRLPPTTLSWFGVERQFDFDLRGASPRAGARRFELGTPGVGAAYTALGGLAVIERAGIPSIRARNRRLADDLRLRLREGGFTLHEAPVAERRSALVLVRHLDAPRAVRELAARDVIVDHRGPFVRFSPHFYNTIEDNERAARALLEAG